MLLGRGDSIEPDQLQVIMRGAHPVRSHINVHPLPVLTARARWEGREIVRQPFAGAAQTDEHRAGLDPLLSRGGADRAVLSPLGERVTQVRVASTVKLTASSATARAKDGFSRPRRDARVRVARSAHQCLAPRPAVLLALRVAGSDTQSTAACCRSSTGCTRRRDATRRYARSRSRETLSRGGGCGKTRGGAAIASTGLTRAWPSRASFRVRSTCAR